LRRQRLHDLVNRLDDEDLLAAELFLELLVEPQPGVGPEEAAIIEKLLKWLKEHQNEPDPQD